MRGSVRADAGARETNATAVDFRDKLALNTWPGLEISQQILRFEYKHSLVRHFEPRRDVRACIRLRGKHRGPFRRHVCRTTHSIKRVRPEF